LLYSGDLKGFLPPEGGLEKRFVEIIEDNNHASIK
jgi:hypothetical protein